MATACQIKYFNHPPNLALQLKKHQKLQSNKLKFSLKKKILQTLGGLNLKDKVK
jgi:hypothetical protein